MYTYYNNKEVKTNSNSGEEVVKTITVTNLVFQHTTTGNKLGMVIAEKKINHFEFPSIFIFFELHCIVRLYLRYKLIDKILTLKNYTYKILVCFI